MRTITDQQRLDTLAENIIHREREVFGYQVNIDNYLAMLQNLPQNEWPAHLAQYQEAKIENLPMAMSDADVQLIVDYQYRDRLKRLLRTEKAEQGKSNRVRDAMITQLPPGQRDQLITQAKTRIG